MKTMFQRFAVRNLAYVTNHVVSHLPSFVLRRAWYRAMGVRIGPGSGVYLNCYLSFFGPGHTRRNPIIIGAHTRINRGCYVDARGPLFIGDNVSISPEVAIITTQHDWRQPGFPLQSRPVVIDDNVWVGMRAVLLPGTRLGRGAVVAAGAVTRGEVPAGAVVAGVPARIVAWRSEAASGYEFDDRLPLYE